MERQYTPKQFESELRRLLEKIGELESKLKLEHKIGLFPPIPIGMEDMEDSVRVFPPGAYLTNIDKRDIRNIENLLEEWKRAATIGPLQYEEVMRKYAGDMEFAYNFLILRYKPHIYFEFKKRQARVEYEQSYEINKEKRDITKVNKGFATYFRKEIENREEEIKERIKKLSQPISDEEMEKFREDLYGDEIENLKRKLGERYNQEAANRLWETWGKYHENEFFDIIRKGKRKS